MPSAPPQLGHPDCSLRDRRVLVMGLGRFGGGIAAARWLVEQGARVLVTDRDPADRLAESIAQLQGLPVELRLGEHRESDFIESELIVTSPAVPPGNPFLAAARARGIPITTEIRLFLQRNPARRTIGITGTKGKSTTTALLGKMLSGQFTTWVGGNIGRSLLADLPRIAADDLVVLELSSFMLEYLAADQFSPHIAVVTIITADHLEWHGSTAAYVQAKQNLVRWQRPGDIAVLPANRIGGAEVENFARLTRGKVVRFDADPPPFALRLAGHHNQLNAHAAFAAAACLGITREQAQHAIADFPGLPHRMQLVHEANGIRWINDSIATGPDAAIAALLSFDPRTVIQIVGGKDKSLDMAPLAEALANRAKVTICIGQTGPQIAAMVRAAGAKPESIVQCPDLAGAADEARKIAQPGDVILLSPGYASFDQFNNFEQRGEAFARLAKHPANVAALR
jgi:UDP-N-acetylmuramoylalanine--D-glutamate ligase